jgi:hypothetical protein
VRSKTKTDRSLLTLPLAVLRHTWTSDTILAFCRTSYTTESDTAAAATTPIILSQMFDEAVASAMSPREKDGIVSSSPASISSSNPGASVVPDQLGGHEIENVSEFSDETISRIARSESVSLGHDT